MNELKEKFGLEDNELSKILGGLTDGTPNCMGGGGDLEEAAGNCGLICSACITCTGECTSCKTCTLCTSQTYVL